MPNPHIMVIEDDADTMEYMIDLLTLYEYKASRWMTSVLAVEQVAERQPDLVIVDNRLTGGEDKSGWEIVLRLHAEATTRYIPVILYSAEYAAIHAHRDEIRQMGGDVLKKPFTPQELLAKIQQLIGIRA